MLDFFREAQYGAVFLVGAGAFGYWISTFVGMWQQAQSAAPRAQEVLLNVPTARFVTYGMVVCGLAWWVVEA